MKIAKKKRIGRKKILRSRRDEKSLNVKNDGIATQFSEMLNEHTDITIDQLCTRTGLSRQSIYLLRLGETSPSAETMYRLQKILNIDLRPTDFILYARRKEIDTELVSRLEQALNGELGPE